jgi:hypothetical protein
MGLLVAGITGGASLIDNARITSLKREIDNLNRDLFTFYARIDRFPGDFDNSGKIGYLSENTCPAKNFQAPYFHDSHNIAPLSCPFVDLYLHEISTFKPNPTIATDPTTVTTTNAINSNNIITTAKSYFTVPFSKTYKDFVLIYRTRIEGICINMFMTEARNVANKRTMDITNKIESKFDDGIINTGDIIGYCSTNGGSVGGASSYGTAAVCSELFFLFKVR